ncbi:uncharacterized protein MELLADRAFT_112899 [Melampsora larici-populina 98AG31]|uniref:Vacuolar protein-sorting-associated protein 36 n=1 Tax=Melampsora larici-populina (strain 98AG31 / pathotype 3-4-7) TaxID=747676 RepID=F4S818_MELLP|nr:uncharacterized protein MELLADRAFT_112899 [Melampsora larici-populina 98AG31]EGF99233.1 hypothetical protein MELLADRAFT_112899 [Melampsora larici-populina 98AG31]
MHRLRPINTSNQTVRAQLFSEEQIIEHQAGVGLYDGKEKCDHRTDGDLYLTSHRLIYIDTIDPQHQSCFLDLNFIRQTEYWIGFLKSSPKITLLLGEPTVQSSTLLDPTFHSVQSNEIVHHLASENWTCSVCGFSNLSTHQCGLCGIPRPSSHHLPSRSTSSSSKPRSVSAYQSSPNVLQHTPRATSLYDSNQQVVIPSSLDEPTTQQTCPTCTFINHSSMTRCEICDSILKPPRSSDPHFLTKKPSTSSMMNENENRLQHSRASTPAPPASYPSNSYIRLSFRKGGDKGFYNALKSTLQTKAWLSARRRSCSNRMKSIEGNGKAIGIDGIMRSMDSKLQAEQAEMNEGLKDLEALMAKAKEMVQMAQVLNSKLTALESSTNSDEDNDQSKLTIIRSSLLKLGLPTPAITSDMMENDERYEIELSKELAGLLSRSLDGGGGAHPILGLKDGKLGARGIVSLDEVWCLWNRARGVGALLSPRDFLLACERLPIYTEPKIRLLTLKSGLKVLNTSYYESEVFGKRLIRLLEDNPMGRIQTIEMAQSEGLSISLTFELIRLIEIDYGWVIRDSDDRNQVYWYLNLINDYHWNDVNFV